MKLWVFKIKNKKNKCLLSFMKYHPGICNEIDMMAYLLTCFNFESGLLSLKQTLPVLPLSKNTAEAEFSFCSPIWLFCTPTIFMEEAKFIQQTRASSKHVGGEMFLSEISRGFWRFYFIFNFFVVLEIQPKASWILDRCFTTELHCQSLRILDFS